MSPTRIAGVSNKPATSDIFAIYSEALGLLGKDNFAHVHAMLVPGFKEAMPRLSASQCEYVARKVGERILSAANFFKAKDRLPKLPPCLDFKDVPTQEQLFADEMEAGTRKMYPRTDIPSAPPGLTRKTDRATKSAPSVGRSSDVAHSTDVARSNGGSRSPAPPDVRRASYASVARSPVRASPPSAPRSPVRASPPPAARSPVRASSPSAARSPVPAGPSSAPAAEPAASSTKLSTSNTPAGRATSNTLAKHLTKAGKAAQKANEADAEYKYLKKLLAVGEELLDSEQRTWRTAVGLDRDRKFDASQWMPPSLDLASDTNDTIWMARRCMDVMLYSITPVGDAASCERCAKAKVSCLRPTTPGSSTTATKCHKCTRLGKGCTGTLADAPAHPCYISSAAVERYASKYPSHPLVEMLGKCKGARLSKKDKIVLGSADSSSARTPSVPPTHTTSAPSTRTTPAPSTRTARTPSVPSTH